jgi:IMP dehydrogenase
VPIKETPLALTFADVSLVPRRSSVVSRADVDTTARFSRNIELKVPVVSANMDTVTTAPMAIAMAQLGGLGVIHRFLSIEDEANEVSRVKRASHYKITEPYFVDSRATVEAARRLADQNGVSGLLVVEGTRLIGILTHRDMLAARDPVKDTVASVMTERAKLLVATLETSLDDAERQMLEHRVEKLPIVADDDSVLGLFTLRDVNLRRQFPLATRDSEGRLRVAASIGIRGDYLERAHAMVTAGADALVLDVAHGHMEAALQVISEVKSHFPDVDLVAGNVATAIGVGDLAAAGADGCKLGVGPGAVCETRVVAGTGVPQWTVVNRGADAAARYGIPACADGGITEPGDVAKAIGAGASTVMVGSLLAGTDESPGEVLNKNGRKYKVFRGMASAGAAASRLALEGRSDTLEQYVAEGVEVEFELKGPAGAIINWLAGGLRSGMAYSDSRTVSEFWEKAEFVQQTMAGRIESKPHARDRS